MAQKVLFGNPPLFFFIVLLYNFCMDVNSIMIHKNRRAKNLRLSVNKQGQPVLTIPFLCPKWYALRWAEKQAGWIQKHTFQPQKFVPNQVISLCGKDYLIIHDPKQKGNTITNMEIVIGGDLSFFNRRVKDLIKKEFLSLIQKQVREYAQKLGVHYGHITLRDTSSRWGSCSSSGNLSFCWRVAMAPDFVIRYLIAHEVSHLKHMDHSPYFWKTVATLTPDIMRSKNWLRYHAQELQIG